MAVLEPDSDKPIIPDSFNPNIHRSMVDPQALPVHERVGSAKLTELSEEQLFDIRAFDLQVDRMSEQQAKSFLKEMKRHMIYQKAMYDELLRTSWFGDDSSASDKSTKSDKCDRDP